MYKLFTHTDLDGIGCAILAKIAFKENVDITYCNYDDVNNKVEECLSNDEHFNKIFITDISVNDNLANKINNSNVCVELLDHHSTALELNKYKWCKIKIENNIAHIKTSGTELFYDLLINNRYLEESTVLDNFIEVVRDYDTWRWSTLGSEGLICKQVNDLFHLYRKEKFIEWCMTEIHDCVFPLLYTEDKLVLDTVQKKIDDYVTNKNSTLIKFELCGKKCGIVFADKYLSELGNRLCTLNPDIDFVAMIDMSNKCISYRTIRNDIDLGNDIAKKFNGGGHPKASGSRFDKSNIDLFLNTIFSIQK